MSLETVLSDIGLHKNKGAVYLACLRVGSGSAHEIAQQLAMPRTTVHEILQQLVGRGVVSFVTKGRTRIYTPEPPQRLRALLKEKEHHLESVLPELSAMFGGAGVRPQVRFYEGVAGVKTVFEDTLTVNNKLLRGILSMEDLYKIPGKDFMENYVARRVSAGIKLQVIRSEQKEVEETWPFSAKENRELHYAPKEMVFPMTMYFYDNKVSLISTQKENFGMIIQSEDYFKTQQNLFEVLWQVTRISKRVD